MGVFVKICGLANRADAIATAGLRPDALGFVFWEHSIRCVAPEAVRDWTAGLPARLLKVGVFVNASEDRVCAIAELAGLDVVQLHGEEDAGFCERVSARGIRVWKVFSLPGDPVPPAVPAAEAFLVDSGSAVMPGGTGILADWNAARDFVQQSEKPVLLAGGLNADNVKDAVRQVAPWGVDVSSGVEARPGKKDLEQVKAFIENSRAQ